MITLNMYFQSSIINMDKLPFGYFLIVAPRLSPSESKGTANGTLPYSALPPEAVFANSLGALIVVFGLVVLRILSNRNWERPEPGGQDTAYRVRASLQSICALQLRFMGFLWGSLTW